MNAEPESTAEDDLSADDLARTIYGYLFHTGKPAERYRGSLADLTERYGPDFGAAPIGAIRLAEGSTIVLLFEGPAGPTSYRLTLPSVGPAGELSIFDTNGRTLEVLAPGTWRAWWIKPDVIWSATIG